MSTLATTTPGVPGYHVGDLLHSGVRYLVYRASDKLKGRSVVLKIPRNEFPTDREIATQKRTFEIAQRVSAGVITEHIELVTTDQKTALVTEDIGGLSLDYILDQDNTLDLESAFKIAIALSQAVGELHRARIIHRDINPGNVIWNVSSKALRLIDLESSSLLEQDATDAVDDSLPASSLVYIAPEQSGRTSHAVDYRADLYSMGIILYELFGGRPPFGFSNSREQMHAHMARKPPLLTGLAPSIPAPVATVVHKLLEKSPEDRYASALGVAKDLRRCREDWQADRVKAFALSTNEFQNWLVLPNRLYGREAEVKRLTTAINRAKDGQRDAIFVSGYSGVGKSALIQEIHTPVIVSDGLFCTGKFDQFRRDVPYLGWRKVLQSLVRQLLSKPENLLAKMRDDLNESSSGNISLIIELVPELQSLLGEQPTPPPVNPTEAQRRFTQAFRNFIRVITNSESLIVLFIDDLQWADLASLKLLEALVSDRTAANLILLGAYRDNEVNTGHPLTAIIDSLQQKNHSLSIMTLSPLRDVQVEQFVSDTVKPAANNTTELARLVLNKTAGNPFFVRQFLTNLFRKNLLSFETKTNTWNWDLKHIEAEDFTDNVIDLVSARISRLPDSVRKATQIASCLGAEFNLQNLAKTADRPISEIAIDLEGVMQEGLIVPLHKSYRYAAAEATSSERNGRKVTINPKYRFLHDRVQQTAHEGIPADERAQIHLRIARERRTAALEDPTGNRAIDAIDHLGHAIEQVTSSDERIQFAQICLIAAQKAKAAMAVQPAFRYLEMGRSLIPEDAWSEQPRLALDLHIESADIAYILENYDEAESLGAIALEHSTALSDRVPIHNIRIGIGAAQRRYVDATRYGIDILNRELDIKISQSVSMPQMLVSVLSARYALSGYDDEAILNLPDLEDERLLAAMAMMMKCATNAYWANQFLVPILAERMLRLSLRHGKCGLTAYGLGLLGMIITQALNSPDFGCRIGSLSMEILERTGDKNLIGKTGLLWHGMIRHSKEPLRLCAADTLECYHYAMDAGDVENAVYCGVIAYFADVLSGRSLAWMEKRYRNYISAILESEQNHTTQAFRVWLQAVENLADGTKIKPQATGQLADWPEQLARLLNEDGSGAAIAIAAGGAGWLAFLLNDWNEADRQFSLLYERETNALGQCFWKPAMCLYAIVLARKAADARATGKDRVRLTRLHRSVRWWAKHNAHDYACFASLIEAEIANGKGRRAKALLAWGDAMELAHDSGILYVEAWAAEQAANTHAIAKHISLARFFNSRAKHAWEKHGSLARLLLLSGNNELSIADKNIENVGIGQTGLDFDAVLRAVRSVSAGIEVEKLAEQVVELSLLSAGARRGVLLIQNPSSSPRGLSPYVTTNVDSNKKVITSIIAPINLEPNLPHSLLNYVSRTNESFLVDDAQTHEWLARDPYIVKEGCRSLLAIPLLRQSKLVGLILLENDLGAGFFSKFDAEVVQIIAGQAAISLENARVFDAQRRQTEAFSRFVPRPFLEQLGREAIEDVHLGDAVERRVTVLFADLRDFTTLSESMDINENFGLINAFIARLAPVITSNGGFINEFTGDGFKALFVDNPQGATNAAIGIQGQLRRYNSYRKEKGRPELQMGVGVHTGQILLGVIGSQDRTEASTIGDTVNTAARIEGLTKMFYTPSLISGTTRAELEDASQFAIRQIGQVRVKGRHQPISAYELIDAREADEREALIGCLTEFNAAMVAYQSQNFSVAASSFAKCCKLVPKDHLSQYYFHSATELVENGTPPNWDGVIVRAEK